MTDEAWSELRARDELAALSDGINAVDVEHDIGDDPLKTGHYERALDIRDQADAALGKDPSDDDLDRAQDLILEARRELHAAVPSLAPEAPTAPAPQVGPVAPIVQATPAPFVSELLGEVFSDPQGFRERMKAQAEQIRAQAKVTGTGQSTVVMFSSSGGFTPVVRPGSGPKPDLAETLEKLAALRDRGALTEEEFEAQKKKLLGS